MFFLQNDLSPSNLIIHQSEKCCLLMLSCHWFDSYPQRLVQWPSKLPNSAADYINHQDIKFFILVCKVSTWLTWHIKAKQWSLVWAMGSEHHWLMSFCEFWPSQDQSGYPDAWDHSLQRHVQQVVECCQNVACSATDRNLSDYWHCSYNSLTTILTEAWQKLISIRFGTNQKLRLDSD